MKAQLEIGGICSWWFVVCDYLVGSRRYIYMQLK
uniref:Uncharacterized protein n=1 Tax=Arundo donax TaxID=35708 RepID=A0A0A9B5N4_ARUDO